MVFASMLPWRFFATSFSEAGNSLIANANMISVEDMKQGECRFTRLLFGFPINKLENDGRGLIVGVVTKNIILIITMNGSSQGVPKLPPGGSSNVHSDIQNPDTNTIDIA